MRGITKHYSQDHFFDLSLIILRDLQSVDFLLPEIDDKKFLWKSIIVAIDSVLYHSALAYIRAINDTMIWRKIGLIDDKYISLTQSELIGFKELFRRIQDDSLLSNMITISREQQEGIFILHDQYRNQFIHHRPFLWVLDEQDLYKYLNKALEVLTKIINASHFEQHYKSQLINYLGRINIELWAK